MPICGTVREQAVKRGTKLTQAVLRPFTVKKKPPAALAGATGADFVKAHNNAQLYAIAAGLAAFTGVLA